MPRPPVLDPQWATVRAARAAEARVVVGKGNPNLLSPFLAQPTAGKAADAAERRAAAVKVASLALRHPCQLDPAQGVTVCGHPDHARDREMVRTALTVLALPDGDTTAPAATAEPAAQQPPAKRRPPKRKPRPDLAWHDHAACNGDDLHLFYDHEGETRHARDFREALARQLCGWCPVRDDCLTHALTYPERYGIWGGLDPDERRREKHNRNERARRKAARRGTDTERETTAEEQEDAA